MIRTAGKIIFYVSWQRFHEAFYQPTSQLTNQPTNQPMLVWAYHIWPAGKPRSVVIQHSHVIYSVDSVDTNKSGSSLTHSLTQPVPVTGILQSVGLSPASRHCRNFRLICPGASKHTHTHTTKKKEEQMNTKTNKQSSEQKNTGHQFKIR